MTKRVRIVHPLSSVYNQLGTLVDLDPAHPEFAVRVKLDSGEFVSFPHADAVAPIGEPLRPTRIITVEEEVAQLRIDIARAHERAYRLYSNDLLPGANIMTLENDLSRCLKLVDHLFETD